MDKQKERDIENQAQREQQFSVAGSIARAGKGLLKGASPVSQQQQLGMILSTWINNHISDPSGSLKEVLQQKVQDALVINDGNLQSAYDVLIKIISQVVDNDFRLKEFVRQVDVHWAGQYQERPHFEKVGEPPDPDDEYTVASVRQSLEQAIEDLRKE